MSMISLRLNERDSDLIKAYAKANNLSISDLIRQSVIEKIEDEIDLKLYDEAMKSYQKEPETISFEDAMKDLELE